MEQLETLKKWVQTGQVKTARGRSEDDLLTLIGQMEASLSKTNVSGSLLSDVDYWKQRCLLAEKCLEESPCDTDITAEQINAWNAYHKFISWAGNDR